MVGGISIARYYIVNNQSLEKSQINFKIRTILAAAVILSNIPIAAILIYGFVAIESCYTVNIINISESNIKNIKIFGGGCQKEVETIPPGGNARLHFWFKRDGDLKLSILGRNSGSETIIDGYVTNSMGGYKNVNIGQGFVVTVSDR